MFNLIEVITSMGIDVNTTINTTNVYSAYRCQAVLLLEN